MKYKRLMIVTNGRQMGKRTAHWSWNQGKLPRTVARRSLMLISTGQVMGGWIIWDNG